MSRLRDIRPPDVRDPYLSNVDPGEEAAVPDATGDVRPIDPVQEYTPSGTCEWCRGPRPSEGTGPYCCGGCALMHRLDSES